MDNSLLNDAMAMRHIVSHDTVTVKNAVAEAMRSPEAVACRDMMSGITRGVIEREEVASLAGSVVSMDTAEKLPDQQAVNIAPQMAAAEPVKPVEIEADAQAPDIGM